MVITRTEANVSDEENCTELEILFHQGSKVKCVTTLLLMKGLTFTILGIVFSIWTPFQLIMDERLRMHKGLPAYDCWASPPDVIVMRVSVFNYTNAELFLSGKEDILRVEEVGPIIYRELMTHQNITRNDNDTITYVAKHTAIYWDKANTIDLNDTIIVPNYAALAMATFLYDKPFFVKLAFNLLLRQYRTKMFKTMTIQNFLWNYTDPSLTAANKLIPYLAPINNIGMLQRIYENFQDEITMYMGIEHGPERFSLIEKLNGSDDLPNYKQCNDKLTNATEGVTYGQFLTRKSVLKYWRKTVCKVVDLIYESDLVYDGLECYKYVVPKHSFDRTYPEHDDCYKGYPSLPNGLTDVSNCMYNVPIVASFPHFLYANSSFLDLLDGITPNVSKHESFLVAEPVTGIPLHSMARSQSNLAVRTLNGFSNEIRRFSGRILPMFWLEYSQKGVPLYIYLLLYTASVLLKPGQIIFIVTLFVFGFWYTVRFGKMFTNSNDFQQLSKRTHKKYNNRRVERAIIIPSRFSTEGHKPSSSASSFLQTRDADVFENRRELQCFLDQDNSCNSFINSSAIIC